MGDKQKEPSTSWAISGGFSISGGGKVGAGRLGFTLFDVNSQIFFPLSLKVLGGSGGIPLNLTISTFSPTFFTTTNALKVKDFGVSGLFASAEMCIGIGGSLAYITFKRIDHNPYWLDVGGLEAGVAAGIGGGIFFATAYEDEGRANNGCLIAPGGDPLCGGTSKSENKSQSSSMQSR